MERTFTDLLVLVVVVVGFGILMEKEAGFDGFRLSDSMLDCSIAMIYQIQSNNSRSAN